MSFGVRSGAVFVSKTWMLLWLPFADPEQKDLKEVAVFALWRLVRGLLRCVRACLGGQTKVVVREK